MRHSLILFLIFCLPSGLAGKAIMDYFVDYNVSIAAEFKTLNDHLDQYRQIEDKEKHLRIPVLERALEDCRRAIEHCSYYLKKTELPLNPFKINTLKTIFMVYSSGSLDDYNRCQNRRAEIEETRKNLFSYISNIEITINQMVILDLLDIANELDFHLLRNLASLTLQTEGVLRTKTEKMVELAHIYEEIERKAHTIVNLTTDQHLRSKQQVLRADCQEKAAQLRKEIEDCLFYIKEQKDLLLEFFQTFIPNANDLEQRGFKREAYTCRKQAVSSIKKFQSIYAKSDHSITDEILLSLEEAVLRFEKEANQNRLTSLEENIGLDIFREREEQRKKIFYSEEAALHLRCFLSSFLTPEIFPRALALDGQRFLKPSEYGLYAEQFYRFIIQNEKPITHFFVKVIQGDAVLHQEKIFLPQPGAPLWRKYLIEDGKIFIPETALKTVFGIDLRCQVLPQIHDTYALKIDQKVTNTQYQIEISLDEDAPIYKSSFFEPTPWQLVALRKPNCFKVPAPIAVQELIEFQLEAPVAIHAPQIRYPLLDQLVQELQNDPLLLAQYVQNEIGFSEPFLLKEDNVFQAPGIQRSPLMTYLEKEGSPFEQCYLLAYLLQQAGYSVKYAIDGVSLIPKEFAEALLTTKLSSEEQEALVRYPWVLFFDGTRWIALFPWMKQIAVQEGFDIYNLLADEFACPDRWVRQYLKSDEQILRHIGPDGNDTAGILFFRFIEEKLRKKGLSLFDVGIHRTLLKKQYSRWKDFSRPQIQNDYRIVDSLEGLPQVFAKIDLKVSSRAKHVPSFRLVDLPPEGLSMEPLLAKVSDPIVEIKATHSISIGSRIISTQKNLFMERSAIANLCFHFGGDSSAKTAYCLNRYNKETDDAKKTIELLSFMGVNYFEKCSRIQTLLANLHKVPPQLNFAFGLTQFTQAGAQVNMHWTHAESKLTFEQMIGKEQCNILSLVDSSSNEHQILRELFQNPNPISTVKLLQLAHLEHQKHGFDADGFLAFTSQDFSLADTSPGAADLLYFPHIENIDLQQVKKLLDKQWLIAQKNLDATDPAHLFNYVYITPKPVAGETATLLFAKGHERALISSKNLLLNGGSLDFNPNESSGISIPLWGDNIFEPATNVYNPSSPTFYTSVYSPEKISLNFENFYQSLFKPFSILDWTIYPTGEYLLTNNCGITSYSIQSSFETHESRPAILEASLLSLAISDVRPAHKTAVDVVGDPIDVVTGAFYLDELDLLLPGVFPLEIRRNYSNQAFNVGEFGHRWKLSLNPYLVEQDGKFYAAEADGTIIVYTYNEDSDRWEVDPTENPGLRNLSNNAIGGKSNPFQSYIEDGVLYSSDGSRRYFEEGRLVKWVDHRGQHLTFSYTDDRLTYIESSTKDFCAFHYNPEGLISEIHAKDGRHIYYSYNTQNDLIRVILPNNAMIFYEYDHNHQIIRETRPHGRVLENIYDDEGRVVEQRTPDGCEQQMIVTAKLAYYAGETLVTDGLGGQTLYKIENNRICEIIDPVGATLFYSWSTDGNLEYSIDKRDLKTSYVYDEAGNPIEVITSGGDLQEPIVKQRAYDALNNCIEEQIGPKKTVTTYDETFPYLPKRIETFLNNTSANYLTFSYDKRGRITQEDYSGAVTQFEYDTSDNPIRKTQYTGTEDPEVISEYRYNLKGDCIEVRTATGTQENSYDIVGNLIASYLYDLDHNLLEATFQSYDLNSTLISTQKLYEEPTYFDQNASGKVKAIRAPDDAYTLFEYDPLGNLTEETDPRGFTTYRTYDPIGRLIHETKVDHTTSYTYEPGGLVASITTPGGAKTERFYTSQGLLKEEIYPDGTKSTFTYDALGRPILETKNGVTISTLYDDLNHCRIRRHGYAIREIETFDARGNSISFIDAAGNTTTKTYDGLNRIKSLTNPKGETILWSYTGNAVTQTPAAAEESLEIATIQAVDAVGNCIALIDLEGRFVAQYFDGLSRLIKKEFADGTSVTFVYDLDSNLIQADLPNGNRWIATYDTMHRKTSEYLESDSSISQHFEYTYENGRLTSKKDPLNRLHTYCYDSFGRLIEEHVDNWHRLYTYDPLGNISYLEQYQDYNGWSSSKQHHSIIERTFASTGDLLTETITLDNTLLQTTSQTHTLTSRTLQVNDHTRHFTYENGHLIQVATPQETLHYTYNAKGELIQKRSTLATTNLTYNSTSHPLTIQHELADTTLTENITWDSADKIIQHNETTFSYTPTGELLSETPTPTATYDAAGQVTHQNGQELTWDPWGRLIKVTTPTSIWEASYDALDRRLTTRFQENRTVTTTISYYDPEHEFREIGTRINNRTYYKLYGPTSCDAVTDNTSSITLLHNALGHLTTLIDHSGITPLATPSPYGEALYQAATSLTTYAAAHNWHSRTQDATGLIWMGARYYNPTSHLFLTPDPVPHPISLDLYIYANGDPINLWDPDGRFSSAVYETTKSVFSGIGKYLLLGAAHAQMENLYDYTSAEDFVPVHTRCELIAASIDEHVPHIIRGITHGAISFGINNAKFFAPGLSYLGSGFMDNLLENDNGLISANKRFELVDISIQQINDYTTDENIANFIGGDLNNPVYNASRYGTEGFLTASSLVRGGFALFQAGRSAFQLAGNLPCWKRMAQFAPRISYGPASPFHLNPQLLTQSNSPSFCLLTGNLNSATKFQINEMLLLKTGTDDFRPGVFASKTGSESKGWLSSFFSKSSSKPVSTPRGGSASGLAGGRSTFFDGPIQFSTCRTQAIASRNGIKYKIDIVKRTTAPDRTFSTMRTGRNIHTESYRGFEGKEFTLPSGRRIDYLDEANCIIYELKPNNPESIKLGIKQVVSYVEELNTHPKLGNKTWKIILEVY